VPMIGPFVPAHEGPPEAPNFVTPFVIEEKTTIEPAAPVFDEPSVFPAEPETIVFGEPPVFPAMPEPMADEADPFAAPFLTSPVTVDPFGAEPVATPDEEDAMDEAAPASPPVEVDPFGGF